MEEPSYKLHDAELLGIEINRLSKSMNLRFAVEGGEKTIKLGGVSHFRAVDLITQNVVSRIIVSNSKEFPPHEIMHRIKWVTSLSDGSSFANEQQIADIQRRISERELLLFVLEPSWGAEIVIIAQEMEIA